MKVIEDKIRFEETIRRVILEDEDGLRFGVDLISNTNEEQYFIYSIDENGVWEESDELTKKYGDKVFSSQILDVAGLIHLEGIEESDYFQDWQDNENLLKIQKIGKSKKENFADTLRNEIVL